MSTARKMARKRREAPAAETTALFAAASKPLPDLSATIAHFEAGRYAEALEAAQQVIALAPDWLSAYAGAADAAARLGRFDEARLLNLRATRCGARTTGEVMQRGFCFLALGDWRRAYRDLEARKDGIRIKRGPRFNLPEDWDGGESLGGRTLLVEREQGIGDEIQLARFLPEIKHRFGGRIVYQTRPELVELMRQSRIADAVVPIGDRPEPFHEHVLLGSLPHILGTTLDSIPAAAGYLRGAGEPRGRFNPKRAALPWRVGLCWAGNPANRDDHVRSMPLEALKRLIAITPSVQWVSLMHPSNPRASEVTDPALSRIEAPAEPLDSFAATARVIGGLDLVVSVDTAVAHLAGALGEPCWLLLPVGPNDPRWGMQGATTPLYHSLHLWRQSAPADWMELVERVGSELERRHTPQPEAAEVAA